MLDNLIAGNTYWFRIGVLPSQGEGDIDMCIWESNILPPTLLTLSPNTIKIKYHAPINPATANSNNLKIWGDETGQRAGTYTVAADTVTFTANVPFRAGELIHITSKSAVQFTGGAATTPFSWLRQSPVTNLTAATFDTIGTGIVLPAAAYAYGYTATMADLNLDGLQDLVYLYYSSYGAATNVLVYLRNANGTFAAPLTYSNAESHSGIVGTPDLNNDGYPDLVITHNVPSRIQVRLNNGAGGFGAASLYTVTNYCNGARVADMDNDGDLDIIAYAGNSSLSLNTISILKNNGNGTFAAQVTTNTSVFGTSLQPADLDNDGDMDLAYTSNTAFGSSKVFRVYQNDGTGALTLNNSEANNQEKSLMPAFDYTSDGNVDLITRNPSTEIYLNNSGISYSLGSPTSLSAEESFPLSGDLDGDGDLDLLIPNSYNGTNWNTLPVKILLNGGAGTFTTNTTSLVLPTFFWGTTLTDYESDGDLDHIYLNPATGEVKVLRNGGLTVPPCTNLTIPLNAATNVSITTYLTWAAASGATGYKLTVGTTPGGTDILDNFDAGNVLTYDPPGNFPYSTTIYVKITPYNASGDATGCLEESFTTADQCPPGNVILLTQAEVDAFALTYPACTQINGNLTIGNFGNDSNIDDLSGLSALTAANGLYIYSNPLLTDLTGLDNFTTIPSEIQVYGNNGLTNLAGLGNLSSVGSIKIAFNNSLVNLMGIGPITGLPLDLQINFNPVLTSLAGLSNLTFTGLDLGLTYNNALSDLTALSNLDSVGGHLTIGYCPSITSLAGLENLTIIVNQLTVLNNAGLASLLNLNSLQTIGGNLEINGNSLLSNCEAQAICDYLSSPPGTITIQNNAAGCDSQAEVQLACAPSCTNLTNPANGATNVPVTADLSWAASSGATGYKLTVGTTPGGTDILNNYDAGNVVTYDPPGDFPVGTAIYVKITPYNASGDAVGCSEESFTTVFGCPIGNVTLLTQAEVDAFVAMYAGCTQISGNLRIGQYGVNSDISNIAGLSSLTNITGHLDISWNPNLTSIGGLANITDIGSFLQFDNNDGITSLLDFFNLNSIGGSIYIIGNSGITSLQGFEGVSALPGGLILNSNSNLSSCNGLENLQSIGSDLTLLANSSLTDLTALSNVSGPIPGYLNINYNASLVSLQGLENITSITYGFNIEGNNSLASLLSLTGLTTIGGSLTIMNNPALTDCDALAICNYLAVPPGTISISNNATGCNNQTEIETACALPPSCTSLTMPMNAAANVPINSNLSWTAFANATGYKLTIGTTPGGTDILNNFNVGNISTYDPPGDFPYSTTIYVKITPYNANGDATGCTEESFTTEGCLPNLVIATMPIPDGTYMSLGDLTAHNATVANMSTVIFTSDTGILLEHDFEVELGAVFEAYIQGCPTNLVPPVEEK